VFARLLAGSPRLLIATVPLQHLDLVPVGVLHEKETCHQRPVAMKLLDRVWRQTQFFEPRVLAVQILNRERDMAIGIAVARSDPC
jgi:hypothetical protein